MLSDNRIIAEVTFLSPEEGGRKQLPQPPWDAWYMPHAVAEGTPDYLGVRFIGGPPIVAGEVGRYELLAMYPETVDYSALQPGVAFTIREGARVVARGRVLECLPASTV